MEARWAGVYLLRLFSTGGVAAGAAFEAALAAFSGLDAALVVLAAGAAAAFAGLGSAFCVVHGFSSWHPQARRFSPQLVSRLLLQWFRLPWYASPDRCLEIHLGVKNTGQWLM